MTRCPLDELMTLDAFYARLRARPNVGFVVATAEPDVDLSVTVQVSDVGCTPLCLIALGNELLTVAAERLSGLSAVTDVALLLAAVEQARAALALASDVERVS